MRRRIEQHVVAAASHDHSARRRLIQALWRTRSAGLLFLGGARENRPLPDADLVEFLVRKYRAEPNFQRKLNRLWIAVRELMPASYLPNDVHSKPALAKFLPYWDCVLGDWAAAASWHGWHGHLEAGTIAPLNSQMRLRSQSLPRNDEFLPEVILPPDGALASAYYSIAGLLGIRLSRWSCLYRAGEHIRRAIEARAGPTDNLLAIRGSIRLQLGWLPGAISDFERMLRIRERAGAAPQKIADAQMHLGYAYSFLPLSARGRDLLAKSVATLKHYPNDPNLPRARRKLAEAYKRAGQTARAQETLRESVEDASRLAAYHQVR